MMLPAVFALGAQLLTPVADRVPELNIEPVCQGIAVQGGSSFHDPSIPKERQDCVNSEREVRAQLVKRWSTFSAADRTHCVAESETNVPGTGNGRVTVVWTGAAPERSTRPS